MWGKCWRALPQARFSFSTALYGIAILQTSRAGRAGRSKVRLSLAEDVPGPTSRPV